MGADCPADNGTATPYPCLGRPLCPDCYDYTAAVVSNAHAPELWRRTIIALRRRLAKEAKTHGARLRLSYVKIAEFQRRGLIHFHAIFRLDGVDPVHPERTIPPHPGFTAELLTDLIGQVAASAWFATVPHPAKPNGWDITWGAQVDPLVVRLTGSGEITDVTVASYLAKYATKSTESAGLPPGRITPENAPAYATTSTHQGRLIAACLRIGAHPHEDFRRCDGGRTCLATGATSPPRAAGTPPPCAPSGRRAGTGTGVSIPALRTTGTRSSSAKPTWNGPGVAGAPPVMRSWPCPPPRELASTAALPARNCLLRHDRRRRFTPWMSSPRTTY